jgi:4-amino-4-deoxy-L-arabinose transferase-like glycosyltransferase
MFPRLNRRACHYLLLGLVWALVCLPNLGGPGLWDIDEGNNTDCGREMLQSGNYTIPTFNYQLRTDKPALLYWCQVLAFRVFGINEFAARLPSALAALVAVLATWEIGRQTYGRGVGLLAGLILVSAPLFCAAGHFANPDALLCVCTTLTLLVFWHDYRRGGQGWLPLTGVTTGLALLAKGPVGLVLPVAVCVAFLLWRGEWRRILDRRLLWASLLFVLAAAPWYIHVSLETKGQWLYQFLKRHHADRALTPLENHGGPYLYYLPILILGLAPWSIFLGGAVWNAVSVLRRPGPTGNPGEEDPRAAVQFLGCWFAVYFLAFSLVQTKLPNYILPLYPPAALLLAYFLDRWRRGLFETPGWLTHASLVCLALFGVGVAAGLALAGGVIPLAIAKGRVLPGVEAWAWLGGILLAGAVAGWWCLRRGWRDGLIGSVGCSAVLFLLGVGTGGVQAVDAYKAPRPLVQALPADQLYREVRIGCYHYFQPSLVFYCQREVVRLEEEQQVLDFLETPLPCYLFVSARVWEPLQARLARRYPVLGRHYDLYDGCEIVVVSNEGRIR